MEPWPNGCVSVGSPPPPRRWAARGHNPISILIPCHRCVGADGSLTGYAGGVEKSAFCWLWRERTSPASISQNAEQRCNGLSLYKD